LSFTDAGHLEIAEALVPGQEIDEQENVKGSEKSTEKDRGIVTAIELAVTGSNETDHETNGKRPRL
jgi:hypothetical protein